MCHNEYWISQPDDMMVYSKNNELISHVYAMIGDPLRDHQFCDLYTNK